jgi:hypothetical protein
MAEPNYKPNPTQKDSKTRMRDMERKIVDLEATLDIYRLKFLVIEEQLKNLQKNQK